MTKRVLTLMAGVALVTLFSTTVAIADIGDRKDLQVFNDVSKSVTRYTHFTVFDNVDANVRNGVVTLTGQVTMPFKRDDIEKRVSKIDGVKQVNDKITVLPVSQFDDQLRYRIARAIYSNPNFWNYAIGPNPPIHIVVDHSHVTLEGVVLNDMDRIIARTIATNQFGVMSVKNNLKTDAEAKDALEKAF
jgi:hyperosmotically inducible periplasmic protein